MSGIQAEKRGYKGFEIAYFGAMILLAMLVVGGFGYLAQSVMSSLARPAAVATELDVVRTGGREEAQAAADALVAKGSEARPAVGLLAEHARDTEAANREIAIRTLGRLGDMAADAMPDLIFLFLDNDPSIRLAAVETVASMGLAAREAAPELADVVMFDGDPAVVRAAALALGDIVAGDETSIAALIVALDRREEGVRADAALTLGRMGTLASEAREKLARMAETEAAVHIRNRAGWAARAVDPEAPMDGDVVVEMLRDPAPLARALAARELAALARDDALVTRRLMAATSDDAPSVRRDAVLALARLKKAGPEAVDVLVQALDDPAAEVRAGAAAGLGEMGAAAASAADRLVELLDDPDMAVQEAAYIALKEIHKDSDVVLPGVDRALDDHPLHDRLCGHHSKTTQPAS